MITIRKWNAKQFYFAYDNPEDKVDMCIYENGEKCCEVKAVKKKIDGEDVLEIEIDSELSEELGEGEYEYETRINWDPFENDTLKITKDAKKDDN
jgi:hypothetical protein